MRCRCCMCFCWAKALAEVYEDNDVMAMELGSSTGGAGEERDSQEEDLEKKARGEKEERSVVLAVGVAGGSAESLLSIIDMAEGGRETARSGA